MCEYKFRDGKICLEEALPNSKYCILHIDLPEDEESEEFKRLNELKKEKVKEKVDRGDFNFEGAKFLEIDFSKMEIEGAVNFNDVVIIRNASFGEAEIGGDAWFSEAKIGGDALFSEAKIGGSVWFGEAEIGGSVWFGEAEIGGYASFGEAEIGGDAWFGEAKIGAIAWFSETKIGGYASFPEAEIGRDAWFSEAKIGGDAWFSEAKIGGNAWFDKAKIGGNAWFVLLEIKGELSFRDAIFEKPEAQEESCRKAKRIWEEFGDRIEVDYYFYREMEAKRQQKHPIIRFLLELPVQYIFGYGVHPLWVIGWWLITVVSLAFVYWLGNGVLPADGIGHIDSLSENIYFSIVTAATPGYGGYKPVPGFYQALASFEAIFGTFMWAAFIATFARKYMR